MDPVQESWQRDSWGTACSSMLPTPSLLRVLSASLLSSKVVVGQVLPKVYWAKLSP